jgi:hypothetical protein
MTRSVGVFVRFSFCALQGVYSVNTYYNLRFNKLSQFPFANLSKFEIIGKRKGSLFRFRIIKEVPAYFKVST